MAAFIKHIPCETCGSSDARGLYSDDGEYCFSCKSVKPGSEYKDEDSYERPPIRTSARKETMTVEIKSTKPVIDPDDAAEIKEYSTLQGFNFRNIKDETYRQFGVRHAVDESNNVIEQYYPCTQEGQLVGYKIREVPKTFYSKGRTGADCELFMQFRFNRGGKYVMITEGECLLPNTKVLTRKGWVTLEDWNGQEVMQANGEFATPIAKIEKDYEGTMLNYQSGSFVQDLTPKHNMLRVKPNGEYFKAVADDRTKKHYNVPRTVNFESDTDNLLARIQVMLSADFTFREGGDIYGAFKKERKTIRCKQLLDAAGVRYTMNNNDRGYTTFYIHRGHGLNVSKVFDWTRDLPSAATIIEEVLFWDGNSVPNRNQIEYSTVIRENAEFIQTCAHLCGYVSSIIHRTRAHDRYKWMKVSILKGKNSSSTRKGYTEYDYTGKVMCLTMPDGTLLIKQGDSVSCTGNCDSLSGYQMLKDYYDKKDSGFEVAVVSPTTGANSHKQIAAQYKFFDTFENIIVCYDNDKAGQEATEEVIKVLPKGKVKIMSMRMKDANEYLKAGKEAAFISDFFNAKTYTPAGVVGSSALYQRLVDSANVKKVPLPPFMKKLSEKINDIELGTIGVFAAGSGSAKTTIANEMIYFWLFNSPHKVGVVSLELTCEQYAQAMLSRHIRQKISLIRNTDEKIDFLKTEKVRGKAEELFQDSNGGDRFMIIDERDGSIEVLQDKIEELVISCGCRIIVLDPLSDLLDGLSTEAQALFMKWCKSIIKSYNVTFIMISHIRKSGNNKDAASTGAFIPEESIMGSSTIFKSASWVVMMMRDKYNEDPIIRNTTQLVLSKNRAGGDTGPAGELFYDNQQHVLHDKEDWELGNSEF